MRFEQIHTTGHPLFPAIWEIYETSFPFEEKRALSGQEKVMAAPGSHLDAWLEDDGALVGFMIWWDFPASRFVEHYAIAPTARSGGYGSRILHEWMAREDKPVILEIDPVTDEVSRRRLAFYSRLGFVENPMDHYQPSYRPADEPGGAAGGTRVPLRVLSWPGPVSQAGYDAFRHALETRVWSIR